MWRTCSATQRVLCKEVGNSIILILSLWWSPGVPPPLKWSIPSSFRWQKRHLTAMNTSDSYLMFIIKRLEKCPLKNLWPGRHLETRHLERPSVAHMHCTGAVETVACSQATALSPTACVMWHGSTTKDCQRRRAPEAPRTDLPMREKLTGTSGH